jgi:DNA primase
MPSYSDFLEKLKNETDIYSLISRYVPLRPSGKNYVGLCPFHQEKTPSFTVSPERNMFYCFGCHAGGDAIAFLMRIENLTFPEAVEILASKLGLTVPQKGKGDSQRKEDYWKVNDLACSFYEKCLNGPEGNAIREYLSKRGIKEETWRIFRMGYAPQRGALLPFMKEQGVDLTLLLKVGLVRDVKEGQELFHNRLMFPIMDLQGRVIAFGGRALDETPPKYLNSGQTPVFEKGQNLYALHLAKRHITDRGNAIVVEGYMDAISAHQNGFRNTVASLGTSLTREQVKLLSRFTRRVVLAYDADLAGIMATLRSLELFGLLEMEVRVANLAGFKDPDELLQHKGAEWFSRALSSSASALDFAYERIRQKYDWSVSEEKKKAVYELLSLISSLESFLDQEKFIKRLALESGYGEDTLFAQLHKMTKKTGKGILDKQPTRIEEVESIRARPPAAEMTLLQIILKDPVLLQDVENQIDPEDFTHPHLKKILQEALSRWKKGQADIYNITFDDPEISALLSRLLLNPLPEAGQPSEELNRCLLRLKKERLTSDYRRVSEEIKQLEQEGSQELYRKKLEELQFLANKMKSLNVK